MPSKSRESIINSNFNHRHYKMMTKSKKDMTNERTKSTRKVRSKERKFWKKVAREEQKEITFDMTTAISIINPMVVVVKKVNLSKC